MVFKRSTTGSSAHPGSLRDWRSLVWLMVATVVFGWSIPATLQAQQKRVGKRKRVAAPSVRTETKASKDDKKESDKDENKDTIKKKDGILSQKGPIQEIAEPLDKLMDLAWRDGRLSLTTKNTYEAIDPIVDSIREVVGWGGGSSSYGGGDSGFNFEIGAEKVNGFIKREKKNKVMETTVAFTEIVKPFRSMQVNVTDQGRIRITVNASQSAYMLRIRQSVDGDFMVQELNGTEVFAGSSRDFDTFCREHRDYTANRLLPALKHFGLGQVLTPYSPKIQKRVTELVSPWKQDDLNLVTTLTASLASDVYEERVAASEQLEKEYKGNEAILARLVHDSRFHPETRARARSLIREKVEENDLAELDFIDSVASSLDAAYLIDLIRLQTDPEVRDVLVHRLRALDPDWIDEDATNADVVSMVVSQAVNAWASDQVGDAAEEPAIQLLEEQGHFQKVAENTGQLVRLIWHEDQLRVDREHWKKPFGGREISDISKEIKALVKKNNIPKHWFQEGGPQFAAASAKHPQVLFENLKDACGSAESSNRHYASHYGGNYSGPNNPNRDFNLSKMKGELTFDKKARTSRRNSSSGSGNLDKKPFVFTLAEKSGPARSLTIDENKPGELRLMVTGDTSNYIVQLILKKNHAIIQDVRGSKVIAYQAKSFRELQALHSEYFETDFFPLLRHLGMKIDSAVDAEKDANETTSHRVPQGDVVAGR